MLVKGLFKREVNNEEREELFTVFTVLENLEMHPVNCEIRLIEQTTVCAMPFPYAISYLTICVRMNQSLIRPITGE